MRCQCDTLRRQPTPRKVVAIVASDGNCDVHVAVYPCQKYTPQQSAPPRTPVEQRGIAAEKNRQSALEVPRSLSMRLTIPGVDENRVRPPSLNFPCERWSLHTAEMVE